jgi:hypothetical protein
MEGGQLLIAKNFRTIAVCEPDNTGTKWCIFKTNITPIACVADDHFVSCDTESGYKQR